MAQRARHAAAPVLCAALLAAGPASADISFRGFFSQRFEADLGPDSSGRGRNSSVRVLRSTTDLGTVLSSTTPTTTLSLAPGLRGFLSTDDQTDSRVLPRVNASFATRFPRHTLTGGFAVVPDFVSATDFSETGLVDQDVIQFDVSGNLGLSYRVDPINTLSANTFARFREYSEETDSLTPNTSVGGGLTWSRLLDAQTTGNVSLRYTQFIPRGDSDSPTLSTRGNNRSRSQTVSLTTGFERALTESFDLGASAGLSFTERGASTAGGRDSQDIGFVGGLTAAYDATEDTRFSLSLNQSVEPDQRGTPETRTSLGFGVTNRIDEVQTLGFNVRGVLNATTLGGESDTDGRDSGPRLEFSPFYDIALTPDWSARVGYTLRLQDDEGDVNVSNRVFFSVSRALSFLP